MPRSRRERIASLEKFSEGDVGSQYGKRLLDEGKPRKKQGFFRRLSGEVRGVVRATQANVESKKKHLRASQIRAADRHRRRIKMHREFRGE